MATTTSPAASSRRSATSSSASLRRSHDSRHQPSTLYEPGIPIDTLVTYLLDAKRSLSSVTLVVRANEIADNARNEYEDAAILSAQMRFLRTSIMDQTAILMRLSRNLQATYEWGKRDFKKLIRNMDEVDGSLKTTMDILRKTAVQRALRPEGEGRKHLMDFVDEESVHNLRNEMMKSIEELQGAQQSFDGDLLRLDTDIRNLKSILSDNSSSPSSDSKSDGSQSHVPLAERLNNLVDQSSNMAVLLASLTNHFDMCVTAIRTTEGAAALARRKAAETAQAQGPEGVSISGVIAEQESNVSDLEPKTDKDRAEMLEVVVRDAEEVDDVIKEIQDGLAEVEEEYLAFDGQVEQTKKAFSGMMEAYATLGEIGERLSNYLAAEEEFRQRWDMEKEVVFERLKEMRELKDFYDRYANAYNSLIFEVERRRTVQERVESIWRKAQENVDKLLEADQTSRDTFCNDVGEFLPTDLWEGMKGPAPRWKVVRVDEEDHAAQD